MGRSTPLERLNWSSIVRSIGANRSGKALFFKPACVIAAVDLADEGGLDADDLNAEAILDRFSDYVTPFFQDRGDDGHQPLWHLANDQLWTFLRSGQALTSKGFPNGRPGTRRKLLEGFDRLAIHDGVRRLWASPGERRALRDEMLLLLLRGDQDIRRLAAPLFDPRHLSDRDRWPSREEMDARLSHLMEPTLFDDVGPPASALDEEDKAAAGPGPTDTGDERGPPATAAIEGVPSAVDYAWSRDRIVVVRNLASLPRLPAATSARDHADRLEACAVQAQDLLRDLRRRRWQLRDDYELEVERYVDRLPKDVASGNVLLADAAVRNLREMFDAEAAILPPPFSARLKTLMQSHIALRPCYPGLEAFYRAVRTGRIEEALPIDAVDGVRVVLREQTPALFDEGVSAAVEEASAPEPGRHPAEDVAPERGVIRPPPDPVGGPDPARAHWFQVAGVLNALWKVFTSADELRSSTEAWIRAYDSLQEPMGAVLDWLRRFLSP